MKLLLAAILLASVSLFAAIQHLPVNMLVQGRLPERIQVDTIEGTLTQGNMQELQISPLPWPMQIVGWEFQPASIFTLQPTFDIYGRSWNKDGNSSLSGDLRYDVFNQLATLSQVDMKLELAQLAKPFHLPITGKMVIALESSSLNEDGCQSAQGTVTLNQLHSTRLHWLPPLSPQAGTLSCDNGNLIVKLPLRDPQVNASINLTLSPQGEYQLALDLWGMEKRLHSTLTNAIGSEPDGVFNLNYAGELFY